MSTAAFATLPEPTYDAVIFSRQHAPNGANRASRRWSAITAGRRVLKELGPRS